MKKQRGASEVKVRGDGNMALIRWLDNKAVTISVDTSCCQHSSSMHKMV